jgi:Ca2+-binding RTX toxin-like protein
MTFDSEQAYTYKSQHLMHATLRGSNDAHLIGNYYDNRLTGNGGNNELNGGRGNDNLDGGAGNDVAIYSGLADEYEIFYGTDGVMVTDIRPDRDGSDLLTNIERLRFTDGEVEVRQ